MSQGGDLGALTLALAETATRSRKAMPRGGLKAHARRLARSTDPMPDFPADMVALLDGGSKPASVGEGARRVVAELDARMAVKLAALDTPSAS